MLKRDFLKCPKFTQFYQFLTFIILHHGGRNIKIGEHFSYPYKMMQTIFVPPQIQGKNVRTPLLSSHPTPHPPLKMTNPLNIPDIVLFSCF